mgnify:FL=1
MFNNVDPEHAQAYARQHGVSYSQALSILNDYQEKLERLEQAGWSYEQASEYLCAWDELPSDEMIDIELGLVGEFSMSKQKQPDYGQEWRPQTARRMRVYSYLTKRNMRLLSNALEAGDVDLAKKAADNTARWAGWLYAADWGTA